jgi:hypothetical protein
MTTHQDERDIAHEARTRGSVAAVLKDARAVGARFDLSTVFACLPGYWPPDVLAQLDLVAQGHDPPSRVRASQIAAALRSGPTSDPDQGDPTRLLLPVPHPLDGDWRFTAAARQYLLERASDCANGACVLLGTPSLFAHASCISA